MPIRRRWGAVGLLAIGTLLLSATLATMGSSAPTHSAPAPFVPNALPASACTGVKVPTILSGTLADEGTLVPRPDVANATIAATFEVETKETTNLNTTTITCTPSTVREVTNASGGFVLNLTLPGPSCGPTDCLSYFGPYTPTSYRASGGTAGYFLTTTRNGSNVALGWVAALSAATTSPDEFGTVSVDAATSLSAYAWDGAGDPSTANVTYAWQLAGTGWIASGPANLATFTVNGTSAGPAGTATLWVNGSYNGTPIALAPLHLYLAAVTTNVTGANFLPTDLDVGVPAEVTVNATGAGGYRYTATLTPGLDAPNQTATCRTTASPGGTVSVLCAFTVVYGIASTVQPSVTVTNGYSRASHAYPPVTVVSPLEVAVGPDPAEGYVGTPVDVSVSVVAQTGTGPYGPACLVTGDGRFFCDLAPGPKWTLPVSYGAVGTYSAVVTVADSAGVNRTVPLDIAVVSQPS
ncbi:MAG: hypothetical protein L3J81_00160, partial [Thermoplasmata archaeon]|nr:hypothetical protein [Thermoplasmata archaeon]